MVEKDSLKELLSLGLEPDDLKAILNETQSYGLVLAGTMVDFLKVRKALKDIGIYVAYQRVSPRHLFICDELPDKEVEA